MPETDRTSKSMGKILECLAEMRVALDPTSDQQQAEEARDRAKWARAVATEITRYWEARCREVIKAHGEAVPPTTDNFLYDTLTVPDLASVDASFERTQLLQQQGSGVTAMGIDASTSIQSRNSLERMLAHQLAAVHRVAMEHMAFAPSQYDQSGQAKRLNTAARCMSVYQQGLLTLQKIRHGGHQRISVQYVKVENGSQAIVSQIQQDTKDGGGNTQTG